MSPILFNVFINELIVALNAVSIGCHIHIQPVNHLFYVDNSFSLAPSPEALQKLLHVCESYANDTELMYNTKKANR